jgi:hypothetical protein
LKDDLTFSVTLSTLQDNQTLLTMPLF